ncbi:MAG: molybdopterin molybdotransferase MoeA [Deferribacterota bacterium]|nr:molybdopterin molybdotransferase MoeA [Deferribacterota bacterium]
MIEPNEALDIIMENVGEVDCERVYFTQSKGRVLAEDIKSNMNLPPFDNSAMDGYAFHFDDLKRYNRLSVKGVIGAGSSDALHVEEGECARIMTGAPMPKGADTVVEFEKVNLIDNNTIEIIGDLHKGRNVRKTGEDIKKGESLHYLKGEFITPAIIARLVSCGVYNYKVYRRPKVAIISTGSELIYPGSLIEDNKIVESNGEYITLTLQDVGVEVLYKGIIEDSFEALKSIIEGLQLYDSIITIGGISKGDYDIVRLYGKQLGIKWFFNEVFQKPGKPFSFGLIGDKPVFSFPGNPLSSAFCQFFYFLPAIKKMMGVKRPYNNKFKAYLEKDIYKKSKRNMFLNANIYMGDNGIKVIAAERENSNLISQLLFSNGYIYMSSKVMGSIGKGTLVDVYSKYINYL